MTKYTIITHDNSKFYFDADHYSFIQECMKDGAVFELGTDMIRGSDIKRIIQGKDTHEYGPHGITSSTLPSLEEGIVDPEYASLFWNKVLRKNKERMQQGKPWVYAACISWATDQNGHGDVDELFLFIDSEVDEAMKHNDPEYAQDRPGERRRIQEEQRAFFATEDGRAYQRRWYSRDAEWVATHPTW